MARYGNSTESEGGRMDWCGGFIDSIDQLGRHRKHDCPPDKGFGLIMMSSWVMPMFIVPVSLLIHETNVCGNLDSLIRMVGTLLFQIRRRDEGGREDLLP